MTPEEPGFVHQRAVSGVFNSRAVSRLLSRKAVPACRPSRGGRVLPSTPSAFETLHICQTEEREVNYLIALICSRYPLYDTELVMRLQSIIFHDHASNNPFHGKFIFCTILGNFPCWHKRKKSPHQPPTMWIFGNT